MLSVNNEHCCSSSTVHLSAVKTVREYIQVHVIHRVGVVCLFSGSQCSLSFSETLIAVIAGMGIIKHFFLIDRAHTPMLVMLLQTVFDYYSQVIFFPLVYRSILVECSHWLPCR